MMASSRRLDRLGSTGVRRGAAVRKGLLGVLALVAALAGVGAVYQAMAVERDRRTYPPPGRMVDVGGHRLHVQSLGDEGARPTVILEGGAGLGATTWAWVQPALATSTRVVAYDRAGVGWSDRGPEPRDADHIAGDLHAALGAAGVGGPYVLVGHSFGGLYVRAFADRYADEVAGLVLVDPTHPDQSVRSPRERRAIATTERMMRTFDALSRVGVLRLLNPAAFMPGLPPRHDAALRAYGADGLAAGAARELAAVEELTFPQVRRTGRLGERPLVVLSAGQTLAQDPVFAELHAELAALSSNSVHRVVAEASHAALVLDETHAAQTAAAIRQVVEAVRSGRPLTR